MKLISCYIENFGKYENASFHFSRGLTTYQLDNGEGKTTLAAFLRAMLYGMNTERGDSYGIRSRYNPFQGGNYGGWLLIEKGEKIYKIIRYFDKKSATKDTMSVTDESGRECDDLGKIPGESIFGLTEEAFLRTAYITWEKMEIDLRYGIGERLCGLVADDISVPTDKAIKALTDHEKTYHSGRKSGGVYTGYIPETEELIAETKAEIYDVACAERQLAEVRRQYDQVALEEASLTVEIEKMREAGTRRTQWEHYRSLALAAEEEGEKVKALRLRYPKGFPSSQEIQTLKKDAAIARDAQVMLNARQFPKQAELSKREAQFASGEPTLERLDKIDDMIDSYLSESVAPTKIERGTGKDKFSWLFGLGLGFVVLCLLSLSTWPILAVGAGVVGGILMWASLYLRGRKAKSNPENVAAYRPNTELKVRLEDFFWQYGVRIADFAAAARILKEDLSSLHSLRKEKEEYNLATERFKQTFEDASMRMGATLNRYSLPEEGWENALWEAQEYEEAVRMEALKTKRAEEYRRQYGLTEEPQAAVGFEELKVRHGQLQESLRELRIQKQALETKLEKLPKLRAALAAQEALLEGYQREKSHIVTAIEALQTADRNLKDTYLKPMQRSFSSFAEKMGAEWADSISLGDSLQLSFQERGQLRREEHLSDGQRALAALCMRLALMENIYDGEMPFCILDDPFVHLDERHLEEVKKGVRALSEKMQILYFTCHSSRTI